MLNYCFQVSSVCGFHTYLRAGREMCSVLLVCPRHGEEWAPWLILTSAFHKRSIIPSRVCPNLRSCWATSCIHTGSLFSPNLYTGRERWRGSRHCGPSGSMLGLCCVSNVWRREREEGDGKRKIQPQVEMISQKCIYPQCSVVVSAFINMLYFFPIHGGNICQQCYFRLRSHIPCSTYFWEHNSKWF